MHHLLSEVHIQGRTNILRPNQEATLSQMATRSMSFTHREPLGKIKRIAFYRTQVLQGLHNCSLQWPLHLLSNTYLTIALFYVIPSPHRHWHLDSLKPDAILALSPSQLPCVMCQNSRIFDLKTAHICRGIYTSHAHRIYQR
jgi:hypothetical protein